MFSSQMGHLMQDYIPIYLPTHSPTYLPTYYLPTYMPIHPFITYLCITHPPAHAPT